ncbi:scm-like with four MBT domains protein 1 [Clonorchis sinensis]|uniref:Scm-like with four MBT domains protein 1 n=1 Tax=Clonorchis sinensis TaxID=79923 RepID=H2KRE7_CLOSI|nr:scm-like with four MBT domains protein 1 [Clonorchis sinensis]
MIDARISTQADNEYDGACKSFKRQIVKSLRKDRELWWTSKALEMEEGFAPGNNDILCQLALGEQRLEPIIHKGEVLEAVSVESWNEDDPTTFGFWPAEVASISGHMVLFKWCGLEECVSPDQRWPTSSGFWFDTKGTNWHLVRPVGTTQLKGQNMREPIHICSKPDTHRISNAALLESLKKRAISHIFFEQRILYMYEAIRVGWGKYYGLAYCPPPGLTPDRTISNVDAFIRGTPPAFMQLPGEEVFDVRKMRIGHPLYQPDPPLHEFKVGWKVEAVNPQKPYAVQPATIVQVFNSRYFLVELDELTVADSGFPCSKAVTPSTQSERIRFVSYAGSPVIMPVNTSQLRGLHLTPPPGWPSKRSFTWTTYLTLLSNQQQAFGTSVENGLLRPASTNNLHVANRHHLQLYSGLGPHGTEFVHSPSTSLLANDYPVSSSSHVLFCPSEAVFKGVHISEMFPTYSDTDSTLQSKYANSSIHVSSDACDGAMNPLKREMGNHSKERHSSRFLLGMKLEMVLPEFLASFVPEPESDTAGLPLCTATVTRVEESNLLWLLPDLDMARSRKQLHPIMVDARSTDLYPVGWASSVGHLIIAPAGYEQHCEDSGAGVSSETGVVHKEIPAPLWSIELRPTHDLQYQAVTYESEEICPPVYINSKCYLGPFLCRTNLDLLPQRFGPGPTARVMHNLLTRLVSAAYRPIRVLRMFEADWASGMSSALTNLRTAQRANSASGDSTVVTRGRYNLQTARTAFRHAEADTIEQRRVGMRVVILRIRCPRRGIKIEAPVEVCCRVRAVEEFCRQVSLVLEACPHLISLNAPCLGETSDHPQSHVNESPALGVTQQNADHNSFSESNEFDFSSHCHANECPSFCASRLRSRNLDRLPAWKRRMYASLRPFGVQPPSESNWQLPARGSSTVLTTTLRTRSAVAAAQRQQHALGRALSPTHVFSGLINGQPITRAPRRQRGRIAGRFRGSHLRRHSGQLSMDTDLRHHIPGCLKRPHNAGALPRSDRMYDFCTNSPPPHQQSMDTNGSNPLDENGVTICAQKYYPNMHNHIQHYPWRSQRIPIDPYVCASSRFRPTPRPMPHHDGYLQDVNLNTILSDAPRVTLSSNPLFWTPVELGSYLGETDCKEMWPLLAAEAVDGQAFMLLTLPVLHHLVGLRWEDAIRLARHVVSVKRAFMEQFSTESNDNNVISRSS